jgi:hypothetical protein
MARSKTGASITVPQQKGDYFLQGGFIFFNNMFRMKEKKKRNRNQILGQAKTINGKIFFKDHLFIDTYRVNAMFSAGCLELLRKFAVDNNSVDL